MRSSQRRKHSFFDEPQAGAGLFIEMIAATTRSDRNSIENYGDLSDNVSRHHCPA